MIIYSTVINSGGMRRIAEWCARTEVNEIDGEEILYLIFTSAPIATTKSNVLFINWTHSSESYSKARIGQYQEILKQKLLGKNITGIIGDYQTLCYLDFLNVPVVYDVHILGRPLFQDIGSDKKFQRIDEEFVSIPMASLIDITHFNFLRFEHKYIKLAKSYMVNSENSEFFLSSNYQDETKGKNIFRVPLPFLPLQEDTPNYSNRRFEFFIYTFGRLHPQKAQHLLLFEDWHEMPLAIRGLELEHLKPDAQKKCEQRGIKLLEWSDEVGVIVKDLIKARFVLFSSLHEPWGLALQEAMSLGCICIANSKGRGHTEQIEHAKNGFLLDFTDADWMEQLKAITLITGTSLEEISINASISALEISNDVKRSGVLRGIKRNEMFKL